MQWETLAREDGWLPGRCGSAEQAPPGDRDKEPLSLLWQLLWWPCKVSVMLLPVPGLPGWWLCSVVALTGQQRSLSQAKGEVKGHSGWHFGAGTR